MTKRSRRNHSAAIKAKVALSAIKGEETLAQLATRYDVHANQIVQWKNQLLERAADVFGGSERTADAGPDIKTLHAKIGQLALENDFHMVLTLSSVAQTIRVSETRSISSGE